MAQTADYNPSRLIRALYVNAFLLAGVLAAMLYARLVADGVPSVLPAAHAQQAPIAGGSGVYIMPGQLSASAWGVYLLDTDAQTLAVYSYAPGERQLRLLAARNFRHDRRLANFNTDPSPDTVRQLLDREAAPPRGAPTDPGTVEPETAPR